ncbi:MAG: hypothetical protein Q8P18_03205 [Pseudomonadota bacterium]|nr:hypothetical protein [Pseudomonadota bacterium]
MLLLLVGCVPPVEAPTDLDALFHWFFVNRDTASQEELDAAAANLLPFASESTRGTVTHLTEGEQAVVAMTTPADPANATGIFITGPVACSFEDFERVHYALDQEGLYETATGDESYIEYDRAYTSDLAAYEAREAPTLSWDTTYTIEPVLARYTADIKGGMRFVPASAGDTDEEGVGPVVIERAHLPSPAIFEGRGEAEGGDFFDQDYQLDIMLPDAAGTGSVHAYAVWRDLSSLGQTDESEGVQNLILDGLEDFDRDTELVCAAGF